jgi:hypothetical protein
MGAPRPSVLGFLLREADPAGPANQCRIQLSGLSKLLTERTLEPIIKSEVRDVLSYGSVRLKAPSAFSCCGAFSLRLAPAGKALSGVALRYAMRQFTLEFT